MGGQHWGRDDGAPVDVLRVVEAVDGNVTVVVNGEVVIVHTSGLDTTIVLDGIYAALTPGKPVELTFSQARQLAHLILRLTERSVNVGDPPVAW